MSDYFRRFPITKYRFGDAEPPVLFQHIGTYIDLIDRIADSTTSYEYYNISEHERPDVVSHKLYGNSLYGWTFFLLNEKIRINGWPVSNLEVYELAKTYYPNIVLTTKENIAKSGKISVGSIIGFVETGETGEVIRIDYDMGQIIVKKGSFITDTTITADTTLILADTNQFTADVTRTGNGFTSNNLYNIFDLELGPSQSVFIEEQLLQYNSVRYYTDTAGNRVDYYESHSADESEIIFKDTSNLIPVTNLERLIETNDNSKTIKVFKPTTITKIVSEFNQLLLE